MRTVYISIGNSAVDNATQNRLSQRDWSRFTAEIGRTLAPLQWHGAWFSLSNSPYQNACWCVDIPNGSYDDVIREVAALGAKYNQDSIAWAIVDQTLFI